MKELMNRFVREEDGMGTIEIVIIIGVLVALALLFKDKVGEFANSLMKKFFNPDNINTTLPE